MNQSLHAERGEIINVLKSIKEEGNHSFSPKKYQNTTLQANYVRFIAVTSYIVFNNDIVFIAKLLAIFYSSFM